MDWKSQGGIIASSVCWGLAAALLAVWLGPAWEQLAGKYVNDLRRRMQELGVDDTRVPYYLRWWGLSLVGVALLLGLVLHMIPLAIGATYLVFVAPRYLLNGWLAKRKSLLRDQMVGASQALANAARAGLSLPQGLESISKETPEPLAKEFRRIVYEYQCGRPLMESVEDTRQRLDLEGFTLFASAVLVSLERGGKITDSLEQISTSLQENQRLERKLEADTASGRKIILILAIFPLVFLGGTFLLDPQGTGLIFSQLLGQLVLFLVGGLIYGSVVWSRKILDLGL